MLIAAEAYVTAKFEEHPLSLGYVEEPFKGLGEKEALKEARVLITLLHAATSITETFKKFISILAAYHKPRVLK